MKIVQIDLKVGGELKLKKKLIWSILSLNL